MSGIWRVDPNSLPQPRGGKRLIRGGPLIDLNVLQREISARAIEEDDLWIATKRCEQDLENLELGYDGVLRMLACVMHEDYGKSEWCALTIGREVPCDVYRFGYDFDRRVRNPAGLETYLKFSIDEDGRLTIVLVSCHLSR